METVEISDLQVAKILSLNESHFADLKAKAIKPAKLSKTISGFANAIGGELYIGIGQNDDGGRGKVRSWNGFDDEEAANGHIQIVKALFPVGDTYEYTFLSNPNQNGLVLQIQIKKHLELVVASNGIIYKRRSAQNLPVKTPEEIERLKLDKGIASFESQTLDIPVEFVTDSLKIYEFMLEVIPTSEPEEWIKKQLLIKNGKPTVAGTLLFSDEPQAALPKHCGVKIFRYKTKASEGTRETLGFDPISIEGPTYDQIYEAVEKTKEIIETGKILAETGMQDIEYPTKALHEIVTNAVLHRDYKSCCKLTR